MEAYERAGHTGSHLLGDLGPELLVQLDDDAQADQHVLLALDLGRREETESLTRQFQSSYNL